jgi:hypothetical protein
MRLWRCDTAWHIDGGVACGSDNYCKHDETITVHPQDRAALAAALGFAEPGRVAELEAERIKLMAVRDAAHEARDAWKQRAEDRAGAHEEAQHLRAELAALRAPARRRCGCEPVRVVVDYDRICYDGHYCHTPEVRAVTCSRCGVTVSVDAPEEPVIGPKPAQCGCAENPWVWGSFGGRWIRVRNGAYFFAEPHQRECPDCHWTLHPDGTATPPAAPAPCTEDCRCQTCRNWEAKSQ